MNYNIKLSVYKCYYSILTVLITSSVMVSCAQEVRKNNINIDKAYDAYYKAEEALNQADTLKAAPFYVKAADFGFEP